MMITYHIMIVISGNERCLITIIYSYSILICMTVCFWNCILASLFSWKILSQYLIIRDHPILLMCVTFILQHSDTTCRTTVRMLSNAQSKSSWCALFNCNNVYEIQWTRNINDITFQSQLYDWPQLLFRWQQVFK